MENCPTLLLFPSEKPDRGAMSSWSAAEWALVPMEGRSLFDKVCAGRGLLQRRVAVLSIALCVLVSVLSLPLAAGAWTNAYGDRDDRSSFSAIEAVLASDSGGSTVAGWYWGDFEGLSSPNACRSFVMRVLADGSVGWITDFDYPGETCWQDSRFNLAPGEDGTVWMTPGPLGGLAHLSRDGLISTSAEQIDLLGSNDLGFFIRVFGDNYSYRLMSPSGSVLKEFTFEELLTEQGIEPTDNMSRYLTVLSDESHFYVVGYFEERFPFSNEDFAIFQFDASGELGWSTVLDRNAPLCGRAMGITRDYVIMSVRNNMCSGIPDILLLSKENGSVSVSTADEIEGLCTTRDALVVTPRMGATCPVLSEDLDLESTGHQPSFHVGDVFGSQSANVLYLTWEFTEEGLASPGAFGLPALARWTLDGTRWRLEAVLLPYGTEGAWGNRISDVDVNSAGVAILGGSLGRSATIGTALRANSRLYSATLSKGALRNVVGARPSAPRSVKSQRRDDNRVKLSWNVPRWPGGRIRDYVVQQQASDGRWRTIPGVVSTRTSMLLPPSSRGARVRVVAKNQAGLGFAAEHRVVR